MPKTGKTTLATRAPKHLLLAAEKGYNALPGVMAKPIDTWAQFKMTLSELRDSEVKEMFEVIIIDTVDLLYNMCEKFICDRESTLENHYETIKDIPYGAGYKLLEREFDNALQKIMREGYGLILISHAADKTIKDEYGEEYNQINSTIDKKGKLVCERLCDFICYCRQVQDEDGNSKVRLFFRGTNRFIAGSRFSEIRPYTDMNYSSFIEALNEAIDAEERKVAGSTTTDTTQVVTQEVKYDFEGQKKEFQEIAEKVMGNDVPNGAEKIIAIVESHLGPGKKVSDCTAAQSEQLELILFDLRKEFSTIE